MAAPQVQSNGQAAVNDALTAEQQAPPWANVDPRAVVDQLTAQLAGMVQQLAMRDAYIAQLHQALAQLTAAVPAEEHQADWQPG